MRYLAGLHLLCSFLHCLHMHTSNTIPQIKGHRFFLHQNKYCYELLINNGCVKLKINNVNAQNKHIKELNKKKKKTKVLLTRFIKTRPTILSRVQPFNSTLLLITQNSIQQNLIRKALKLPPKPFL